MVARGLHPDYCIYPPSADHSHSIWQKMRSVTARDRMNHQIKACQKTSAHLFDLMSPYFTKERAAVRAFVTVSFARFQPVGGQFRIDLSSRTQSGQPFRVPTDAFELHSRTATLLNHKEQLPAPLTALPEGKRLRNLEADRARQPVDPPSDQAQFSLPSRHAHNLTREFASSPPLAARLGQVGVLSQHLLFLVLAQSIKLPAVMHGRGRECHPSDQRVRFIECQGHYADPMGSSLLSHLAADLIGLCQNAACRQEQRHFHRRRASLQAPSIRFQLPVDQLQHPFLQPICPAALAKAHARLIRHSIPHNQAPKEPSPHTVGYWRPPRHLGLSTAFPQKVASIAKPAEDSRWRMHAPRRPHKADPRPLSDQTASAIYSSQWGYQVNQKFNLHVTSRMQASSQLTSALHSIASKALSEARFVTVNTANLTMSAVLVSLYQLTTNAKFTGFNRVY